jgi:hypothetical protein
MEEVAGDAFGARAVELAVEQVDLPGADLFDGAESELDEPGLGPAGRRVDEALFGCDVHAPDHESPGEVRVS